MIFAIPALVILLVAAFAVALPLLRKPAGVRERSSANQSAVYRDQLREIEREKSEGLLSEKEYEAARAEIGRRLLAVADKGDHSPTRSAGRRAGAWGMAAAILALMVGAGFLYPLLGMPGAPDQPLAARMNADEPDLAVLVARVEQHLAENPDDGRGWDVIAPIYLRESRFEAAENAYANAIRVSGATADRLAGQGEAIVAMNAGIVTDEALDIFRQAEALDPNELRALYFMALAAEQSGDRAEAVERFRRLEGALPEGSPWRDMVDRRIAENSGGRPADGVVPNGPDEEAVVAASELSDEARADMIDGMVAGLEQRLKDNPDDIDGWMRLIRSYSVLGNDEKAALALRQAIDYYGKDSEKGARLAAFGDSLQLSGAER
ncbi:c-type cytochrome biogenesis protein CcmI [Martelella lutilitoris]|uniref:C-type cytochrome biogenesis protein CcmI n=1 Tax=Martelella lutilitoris TaxID=2583532 RepID=A0A5C4JNH3_9HYPH|nr:c-type cytochrome biogenesis protein CcmI [Martelella lutilitoris]TNB47013.1 c-type cytochrome biogenesis protein CcmI [Martelella lutilitoris]